MDTPDSSSDAVISLVLSIPCEPCLEVGEFLDADGYCVDCAQHLCRTCYQHHRRPTPTRHHHLLDSVHMPKASSEKIFKDECTDKCGTHTDKIVEYFCENHQQFGCMVCITLGHRVCNVGYIPTLSKNLFASQEYKEFKNTLETLVKRASTLQDAAERNLDSVKDFCNNTEREIRQFRSEVKCFYDELEFNLLEKVSTIKTEDQRKVERITEQCKTLSNEINRIEHMTTDTESKGQKCRLYTNIKQLQGKIDRSIRDISVMGEMNKVRKSDFVPSTSIASCIADKSGELGSLISFIKGRTIPVRFHTDKMSTCDISDMCVLSDGNIVVIDVKNNTIKLIDPALEKVVSSMTMSSFTGVTQTSDNEIAVVHNGDIEIYTVTDQIKFKRTIRDAKLQWNVAFTNNRFISCSSSFPYRLRIVNMNGNVIETLPTEIEGEKLIEDIGSIAIDRDNAVLYISDLGTKTVTSLTLQGQINGQFKYCDEWEPEGIAVSRGGSVYVSDSYNELIHILTSNLEKIGVIQVKKYAIKKPKGLAYCDRENKLYVGMYASDVVAVLSI